MTSYKKRFIAAAVSSLALGAVAVAPAVAAPAPASPTTQGAKSSTAEIDWPGFKRIADYYQSETVTRPGGASYIVTTIAPEQIQKGVRKEFADYLQTYVNKGYKFSDSKLISKVRAGTLGASSTWSITTFGGKTYAGTVEYGEVRDMDPYPVFFLVMNGGSGA